MLQRNPSENSKMTITSAATKLKLYVYSYIITLRITVTANWLCRNSHQMCSMKKGVLRNFTKFLGKHLCQGLFLNKVAGLSPLIKSFYRGLLDGWF